MKQHALALTLILAASSAFGITIDLDDVYFGGDDGWGDLSSGICNTGSTYLPGWERLNLNNATYSSRVRGLVLLATTEYLAENPNVASSCAVDDNGDFIDVDVNYACQKVTSDGNMIKISFSIDCNDAPDYEDSDILLGATVLVPAVGEPVVNVTRKEVSCSRFDSNNVECYFGGMRELECETRNPVVRGSQVSLMVRCEVYVRGDDRLPEYAFSCPATAINIEPNSFTLDCDIDPSIPEDARITISTILDNWQALERPANFYMDSDRDSDDDRDDDHDDDHDDETPNPNPNPTPGPHPKPDAPSQCEVFTSKRLECDFGGSWELECEPQSPGSFECEVYSRTNDDEPLHTFFCRDTGSAFNCNLDPTMPADMQAGANEILNQWQSVVRPNGPTPVPTPNPVPNPNPMPNPTVPNQCEVFTSSRLECDFGGSWELECEPQSPGSFECEVYSRINDDEPLHTFFCQNTGSAFNCNLDPAMPPDMQAGANEILNQWQSVVR